MTIHDYDEDEFDPTTDTNTTPTSSTPKPPVLDAKSPSVSAHQFLTRRPTRLLYWRGEFYTWNGRHYCCWSKDQLNAEVRRFLDSGMTEQLGQFHATIPKINEVVDALRAAVLVPDLYDINTNIRTGRKRSLVACQNGMLDLNTRTLIAHSDDWLVLNTLALDYTTTPPNPEVWLRFLDGLFPDDDEARSVLQEIIGYIVSGRTDLQKLFLVKGPRRSGKGTLIKVVERLMGIENTLGISLANLSQDAYALHGAIGKALMVVPDSRDFNNINIGRITEDFLCISGEDCISIMRKYIGAWVGRLTARILIVSNQVPRLYDKSGVIGSRFVPIRLTQSFYGKEDLALFDKLVAELPAILNWALDGMDRLSQRGKFVIPASAQDMLEDLGEMAAPIAMFVREMLIEDPDCYPDKAQLYQVYVHWCHENGHKVCASNVFARDLLDLEVPWIGQYHPRGKPRVWKGFTWRRPDDEYEVRPEVKALAAQIMF